MSTRILVIRYSAFAIVATLCNLTIQRTILMFGESPLYFFAALVSGTLAGLIVKYVLDKRWIFFEESPSSEFNLATFLLYSLTGVITTLLFWGTETVFWLISSSHLVREAGAILGLSVGYIIKYHLDKQYVFTESKLNT